MLCVLPRAKVCRGWQQPVVRSQEKLTAVQTAMNDRQKHWLSRTTPDGRKRAAWRPVSLYRRSVKLFLRRIDTQLKRQTGWSGLYHVQYNDANRMWHDSMWASWPQLALAQDQASDNSSGVQALKYFLTCNVWEWWDASHGAENDLEGTLKALKLWPVVLLLLIVNNLGHSPEKG